MRVKSWPRFLPPLFLLPLVVLGQGSQIQIHGNDEQGLAVPQFPARQGQDAAASQVIADYRAAAGTRWSDFEGQGSIIYDFGAGTSVNGSAQLELKPDNKTRLDVIRNGVTSSLRIQGIVGELKSGDGLIQTLDPADAVAGPFSFVSLQGPGFPSANAYLQDRGLITVNGQALHRITFAAQAQLRPSAARLGDESWSVDLYFDPATHLLLKTASIAHSIGRLSQPFVQVMTYSDYHNVNGAQIPFTYSESADGEHLWTMKLSQVQTSTSLPDSDFTF